MEKKYLNQLLDFINYIVPVPVDDWVHFSNRLNFKTFDKGELLTRAGDVENYMYFLLEGVTRIFQMKNGIEYTLRFNFPICAFNSYSSYITQLPSLINVEAISKVKVFRMSYKGIQSLYDEAKMADRIGRRILELLYVQREMKELQMHSKTAEDNYIELLQSNNNLVKEIPQKYIASYLGITPESLSRIKKKVPHFYDS